MKTFFAVVLVVCPIIAGCTSIKSTYLKQARSEGGLIYFLPNHDLTVSFEVVDGTLAAYNAKHAALQAKRKEFVEMRAAVASTKYAAPIDAEIARIDIALAALNKPTGAALSSKVTGIGVTDAYPDITESYSLHPGLNHFGKNTIDVSISEKGLLNNTKSKTESQVSEIFSNLASSAGSLSANRLLVRKVVANVADSCPKAGPYQFKLNLKEAPSGDFEWVPLKDQNGNIVTDAKGNNVSVLSKKINCAGSIYDVNIEKLWNASVPKNGPDCSSADNCKNVAGLFYRQPLPYFVDVRIAGLSKLSSTVYSASESPTNMLPIKRSFFADSETTFAFDDGVPTKFTEVSEGEFVSLLKLPADIISAYFSAVGSAFDGFKKADSSEAESLKASLELALLKEKVENCSQAIKDGDKEQISALKCSE